MLILGTPMALLYCGMPLPFLWLGLAAGTLAAIFFNIEKIKRFKGAGIEAEMRDVVNKAYMTVDSLKTIAKPLLFAAIENIAYANRWGGMGVRQKHIFINELEKAAKELSLDDTDLESTLEKFYRLHTWDHFSNFVNTVSQLKNIDMAIVKALRSRTNYNTFDFPTKREILDILGAYKENLSANGDEFLDDYLYYLKNKQLRRPEASQND